jgi:hypothetical protein
MAKPRAITTVGQCSREVSACAGTVTANPIGTR